MNFKPAPSGREATPWKVDISARLSESGKRERKFFESKKAAEAFASQEKIRILNHGASNPDGTLSPAQREAAVICFRLLEDGPASRLVEIISRHVAAEKEKSTSVTFEDLFKRFEEDAKSRTKKGRNLSASYLRQIKYSARRFPGLLQRMVCDITAKDLAAELKGVPPSSSNALMRAVKAAFSFAIEHGWASENPAKKTKPKETADREIGILTPLQAAKLVVAAMRHDLELLPSICLGLWAGIRPEQEMQRLQWEHIRLDDKVIFMPGAITKTGFQRYVEVESCLESWLRYSQEKILEKRREQDPSLEKLTGAVQPTKNLRKRLRRLREIAHINPWPQDGARHSYASYWMAVHKDEDRCRDNMGHRTKDELQKHYRKHLPSGYAKRYWAILPPIPKRK